MAALRPRGGLRTRLLVAFLVVSAISALITAALTFREARAAILDRTQDSAVHDLRAQLDSLAPDVPFPPTSRNLRDLALQLDRAGGSRGWRAGAAYEDGPLVTAKEGETLRVPGSLRRAVRERNTAAHQRLERGGEPWLAIGLPLDFSDGAKAGDRKAASGLAVYVTFSLKDEKADIAALVTAAQAGAVPALALAVVPALFAARRVLRPVRRLRTAAEQLSSGALDTRLDVSGNDELADLSRTFNSMAGALEKDDAELRRMEANARRFAADVSHELRTPLAAMTAVTEVLDEDANSGELPPETADAVRLISGETRKLARMVEDLMEISRFDAGAAALHLDGIDVAEAIRKTLQLRGWQGRVTAELPEGLRASLDPRRFDVIVANLVGNALRHGGEPVVVRAYAEEGLYGGEGGLVVEVADQGPGIPADVLPHVFDRFYKADAARARSDGSGLGLAITLENVRLHHGTLDAANSPEGGAVFTLTVPLRQASRAATEDV
ncbi:HAMP domain-containing sensor histidine kinase [Streptomyces sp. WAC 01529]|uniref:sensor histidine kinase n=1 Tax=Streptomyces sp. WAC 01529 TaxID=2203205 RepID=UPI0019D11171|nr:HAMP domain-containing sensor histidine kinase [Streptomyces sp. WAC 01529]